MNINIKPANYWALHDAFLLSDDKRVLGTKLIALDKLIEKKGTFLNIGEKQIKGLEISTGTFIAMEITRFNANSFFPCKIKKYHLQKL